MNEPLWLTEADVVGCIDLNGAIDVVERALIDESNGQATTMEKTHLGVGELTLHALGGAVGDLVGTKQWAHAPGGASPLLTLWDRSDGTLQAVIEAFALGQMRTASMSAIGTKWLARADASVMAMVGSGKQALAQVAAVLAVRPVTEVRVWSPTPSNRADFGRRLEAAGLGATIIVSDSMSSALDEATIITTATRSRAAFLAQADVRPGAHLNAVGAITPERRELSGDLVASASVVVVDSVPAARGLARELDDVRDLTSLASRVGIERPVDDFGTTVFKALGLGLADVAVGAEVLRRARNQQFGRAMPVPKRSAIRWRNHP